MAASSCLHVNKRQVLSSLTHSQLPQQGTSHTLWGPFLSSFQIIINCPTNLSACPCPSAQSDSTSSTQGSYCLTLPPTPSHGRNLFSLHPAPILIHCFGLACSHRGVHCAQYHGHRTDDGTTAGKYGFSACASLLCQPSLPKIGWHSSSSGMLAYGNLLQRLMISAVFISNYQYPYPFLPHTSLPLQPSRLSSHCLLHVWANAT